MNAQAYIDQLISEGKISFTRGNMQRALKLTANAASCMLRRLKQKGQIASPARGYYLIVTPEFRHLGCLPPDFFIDDLMKYLKMDYYVALLSAALYHGAAHQQPQIFQVMVPVTHPAIQCGQVKIQFIKNKKLNEGKIKHLKTRTGYMRVSTPETTAKDLLTFIRQSGGIGHVATVVDELAEGMDEETLQELAKQSKQYQWVQRLGYLLENLGHVSLAETLLTVVKYRKLRIAPLVPNRSMTKAPRDKKWRLAINAKIESDINDDTH